jgi:hypothetical protein
MESDMYPYTILRNVVQDFNFVNVLFHILNGHRETFQTLIHYGREDGMALFNPLNLLDTRRYRERRVCIVCHILVPRTLQPVGGKQKTGVMLYCGNSFCIDTVKGYCNLLKTSMMDSVINIPVDCIRIIMQYSTHFTSMRRKNDNDAVSTEFKLMAEYLMSL